MLEQAQIHLPPESLVRLEWLAAELLRWNRARNLTAITDPGEVLEKHLCDSLTLLPWVEPGRRLLDLGSGAGFPGLPLKIACPGLEVVSIDAVAKKIAFQKHVVRQLHLDGFTPLHGRAEELARQDELALGFDLVTARALTSLPRFVALAAPFVRQGGRLIAMKGPEGLSEWQAARPELLADGWRGECLSLRLPRSAAQRCLILLERILG